MDNIFLYIADCYMKNITPVVKIEDIKHLLVNQDVLPETIYGMKIEYE